MWKGHNQVILKQRNQKINKNKNQKRWKKNKSGNSVTNNGKQELSYAAGGNIMLYNHDGKQSSNI